MTGWVGSVEAIDLALHNGSSRASVTLLHDRPIIVMALQQPD